MTIIEVETTGGILSVIMTGIAVTILTATTPTATVPITTILTATILPEGVAEDLGMETETGVGMLATEEVVEEDLADEVLGEEETAGR